MKSIVGIDVIDVMLYVTEMPWLLVSLRNEVNEVNEVVAMAADVGDNVIRTVNIFKEAVRCAQKVGKAKDREFRNLFFTNQHE